MWNFQVISLVFVLAIGAFAFEDATVDDRLLNGEAAKPGQFPFVAQVMKPWECGTQFKSEIPNTLVRVGSTIRREGEPHNVTAIVMHPEYDWFNKKNNVAIVRLLQTIKFTPNVQPARLPTVNLKDEGGESVTTVGWGSKIESPAAKAQKNLKLQHGHTFSSEHCSRFGFRDHLVGAAICTNLGTCFHDDANPVIDNKKRLVGLISVSGRTFGCQYGDVTVRVFPYLKWIRENTQGSI